MAAAASVLQAMPEALAEGMSASGRTAEKLSLPSLQSKMKRDPDVYESELSLIYNQFKSLVELFEQQASHNFTSLSGVATDSTVAKDLGDRATFLAHVTPFYPKQLPQFPKELAQFLRSSSRALPSGLRVHVAQALILLINRKMIDIRETLELFMELQTLGDKVLRKLAFSHVIHSIRRLNLKHKNDPKNRELQSILFAMLQQEDELKAKRALITLCELHRRKVWFDERTANAICMACFHTSSRIMIAALSFLIDYEKIEGDDDSDDSDSEDDQSAQQPMVVVNKEAIYKANNKGTTSSKKKKKAKLQRVVRNMKKQQRLQAEQNTNSNYYSPLNYLKDAQGFAEKLFSRLQTCNERFEVKMMMLKVIARTVGLHHLILLNFYPYLQKYVQPHQRDVTNLLAAAVQACHDMVPPDAVEPLFKQIVNQFVHDRSRPEAISVGLNVVREICLRVPLLMTEDLLQDLVLYKKSHEKAVSSAARSLLTLFREICPSLLAKKDRGRPSDPKARPKAFGEVHIASNVPGIELLEENDEESDDDVESGSIGSSNNDNESDEDVFPIEEDDQSDEDNVSEHALSDFSIDHGTDDDNGSGNDSADEQEGEELSDDDADDYRSEEDEDDEEELDGTSSRQGTSTPGSEGGEKKSKAQKRKFDDFDEKLQAAGNSLRALKKLAGAKLGNDSSDTQDGILSNEDFQKIKELTAKKDARIALSKHGFKLPNSDQLSSKRVDAAKLEANIRKKLSKEEKQALMKARREERGKYQARSAVKQKKTGGQSNLQKERKKLMPIAAKRAKVAKSRQEKKKKQQRAGKQFRGRKA
nr:protein SDA1 homolog isoform X1 [Ipomoea batatas]